MIDYVHSTSGMYEHTNKTETQHASKRNIGSGDGAVWRLLEAITGALAAVTVFALSLPMFAELVSPFHSLFPAGLFVSMYPMGLLFVLLFMYSSATSRRAITSGE